MTIIKFIRIVVAVIIGLISCTPDDSNGYSIVFSEDPVMVEENGGVYSTSYTSEHQCSFESSDSWISDVNIEDNKVSFHVDANLDETIRNGIIRFRVDGDEYTQDLTIRQAANSGGLKVETDKITATTVGESVRVTVSSAEKWTIGSSHAEWISAERMTNTLLNIAVDPNYTGNERSTDLTIQTASKNECAVINIKQEADNSIFKNATTCTGRRLVHKSGQISTITSETEYSPADCVSAFEMQYKNSTGTPHSIFVYEVNLTEDVTILASCADDDPASIKKTDDEWTSMATIREQLHAMQTKRPEIDVLCGVNGDFCYIHTSYNRNNLLQGVMYKDGGCLKDTFDGGKVCTVFAILKDGTARIMTQADYANAKENIQEAVGGRVRLVSYGQKCSFTDKALHPRTAVGVSADHKKVILLVVDGRQSNYSAGADYDTLADIFIALGASDAINLDGGGSSTFIRKNPEADKGFETRNKPSDSTGDRAIPNGLAVVRKK